MIYIERDGREREIVGREREVDIFEKYFNIYNQPQYLKQIYI